MRDVMLDMETMSLRHNAAILSIGAVLFDPYGHDKVANLRTPGRTFYAAIKLAGQDVDYGRHVDMDTVEWWMKQDVAARNMIFSEKVFRFDLKDVLLNFNAWLGPNHLRLWSYGAASDAVWLESACRGCGIRFPFHYRNIRCARTVLALFEKDQLQVPGLIDHYALDDAIYQVLQVQRALNSKHERIAA